jgi:hypothetical protein
VVALAARAALISVVVVSTRAVEVTDFSDEFGGQPAQGAWPGLAWAHTAQQLRGRVRGQPSGCSGGH